MSKERSILYHLLTKNSLINRRIMSLRNRESITGTPAFNVIDIDPVAVAECLQVYVNRGSKLTGVSLDDIDLSVLKIPDNIETITLVDLLQIGMPLFDAIVWLTAGKPDSHPLTIDRELKAEDIISLMEVARSLFFTYFFLITQARYPARSSDSSPPKVPNFLKVVMGMQDAQGVYIHNICSFNPTQFDPAWVKHIRFAGLGQETLSRFGLGVAGYRMFGPFALYNVKEDLPNELKSAVAFAQKVAKAQPTWDVHPLTRNPAVLKQRGNLNKNLSNLILLSFTEAQINEMVESKVLYAKPIREPSYRNFYQWHADDDISGDTKIFL